jgi:uncharacterized delta-60 repeat protein
VATLACAALMFSAPAALAFEGQPDPSFGTNGQARWPVGLTDPGAEVYAPAIGNAAETAALSGDNFQQFHFFHLEIFSADGRSVVANSLSPPGGPVSTVTPVALVPMPDGHYIAVGHYHDPTAGSNNIALARFNGDGSADVSFGFQVVPETQCPNSGPFGPGNGNIPTAAAAIPGGELLVAGSCAEGNPTFPGLAAVWRFNEQGKLVDVSTLSPFSANGPPKTFSTVTEFLPSAITIAGNGATDYVAGILAGTVFGQGVSRFFLAKYEIAPGTGFAGFVQSGFGDNSVGSSDYAVLGSGNPAYPGLFANAVTTDANGDALVAGTAQASSPGNGAAFAVARFLSNGLPDQSFGSGDQREIPIGSGQALAGAEAVAVRSDGKIWLSGHVLNDAGVDGIAVVRLGPSGQDDDTFGLSDTGQQVYGVPSGQFVDGGGAMFLQPDGFPLVAEDGGLLSGGGEEFVLERITSEVCTLCGTATVHPTSGAFVITSDHGAGGPSMGILVQRLVHGKPVKVGRVPFGPQRLGRVRLHWNLKVAGRPLQPGIYLITVRALDRHGNVVALSNPIRLAIRRGRR